MILIIMRLSEWRRWTGAASHRAWGWTGTTMPSWPTDSLSKFSILTIRIIDLFTLIFPAGNHMKAFEFQRQSGYLYALTLPSLRFHLRDATLTARVGKSK
jgi:hypothetical protein